ncbi:ATP F0F1 synthase subunit delta [Alishewanella sp. WH16-1]|uniref:F0F1 ATP synthase subunit delta n=1 Tax=unclassified Alishewanella TaxID=2628974 RepID=UPI00070EA201|nr:MULTISPECIES: F0F1 ATP synthase subunit delta [unclassified Alishewanella]KRS20504.1 ATP F0F1 synthase subunit delta [Alishewanella sp. WH16-1]MCT8127674.1 F0F1 ATP synthase subunit delta [Alishewanella sp. BS5-314]OZB43460.1 MAG: F0F1 ATP synthase subunit delta [Alishewanella sp. 34-51-39]
MSDLTNIARPYAKAAFDFAVEQNALDAWLQMLGFAAEVAKHEQVAALLRTTGIAEQQAHLFIQVCGEQLNEQGQNLIKVMAENHRLLALPEVLAAFVEHKAAYEKEVTVDVTSATALNAAQQDKLIAALSQRLQRKVKLNCSVNPEVVGGMLIKAGDMVIDGSVRGKLDRLATALQS